MKKFSYKELAVDFKETKSVTSFTRLYNKLKPNLDRYIIGFVKDYDVSQDLSSRTFVKIYSKIDDYDPTFSITTWSYSIAKRECLRWIKRERNKKVSLSFYNENGSEVVDNNGIRGLSFESVSTNIEHDKDEDFTWNEDNNEMIKYDLTVKSINNLKPIYREVLIDYMFNNMKYKEIALKLDNSLVADFNRYESGEMDSNEHKIYNSKYKKILQRVKNRIRRGKMIVESEVNQQFEELESKKLEKK